MAMFMGGILTQHADAATLSLFGNTLNTVVQPNCTTRREYNDFTKQYTTNEVCTPRILDVDTANGRVANAGGSTSYGSSPYYGGSTVPGTYYPYSSFGIWNTPNNPYGYLSQSMFDTYYNGGRGDVTGFYDYWGNRAGNDIDYTNGNYGEYNTTDGLYDDYGYGYENNGLEVYENNEDYNYFNQGNPNYPSANYLDTYSSYYTN